MAAKDRTRPSTWYVYTYAYPDPDGTVFYVGKGTEGRIFDHEEEAERGCPCRKCRTIREIWLSGKPIKKRIEYETLSEQDALIYEWDLINLYDSPLLTNVPRRRIAEISEDVPEEFLTLEQAARVVGRSSASLYNYMNILGTVKYRLPSRGNTIYVLKSDVELIKRLQDVPEEYLTIEQTARVVGRSPAVLYNYMNVLGIVKYKLPTRGNTTYLLKSDVELIKRLIERNRS